MNPSDPAANTNAGAPRVVLITGAAGGLGQGLVSGFADAGWQVAAGCRQHPFESARPEVWPLQMDVTQADQVQAVVQAVEQRWGKIDLLIHNAGVAEDDLVARMSEEAWQRVLDVNLRGAFLCARAVLPGMVARQDGQILHIASFSGRVGRAGAANYCASKAGLLGLTTSLAREHGRDNIRVNALLPGFLRTKLVGTLSEADLAANAASNSLNRLNSIEEVARFALFLATMHNVSGQIFQLDSRIAPWS